MNFYVRKVNRARLCNEAMDEPMNQADREAMIAAAARKIEELFDILQIDHHNDHNTRDTPKRVAKMYVEELLQGRYNAPPAITDFDNAEAYDQLIVTGPIEVRSTCAHHLMPIYGEAYIGILPSAEGQDHRACPSTTGSSTTSASRLPDPGGTGPADRSVHRGEDQAAGARGAHQRRAHVQDPARRPGEPPQPHGQLAILGSAWPNPRSSRTSSCRNACARPRRVD